MTDAIHASPNDVKKLATSLEQFERKIQQDCKDVMAALNRANWHDKQKDACEAAIKDFTKQTNKLVADKVKDMVKSLNELARKLEDAKSHRF